MLITVNHEIPLYMAISLQPGTFASPYALGRNWSLNPEEKLSVEHSRSATQVGFSLQSTFTVRSSLIEISIDDNARDELKY